jgi:hypothetical protein
MRSMAYNVGMASLGCAPLDLLVAGRILAHKKRSARQNSRGRINYQHKCCNDLTVDLQNVTRESQTEPVGVTIIEHRSAKNKMMPSAGRAEVFRQLCRNSATNESIQFGY